MPVRRQRPARPAGERELLTARGSPQDDGAPRARAATAIQTLSPGYFPFVMATGIVSTGTFLLGPSWLSRTLLVIGSAGLAVLLARSRDSVLGDVNGTWLVAPGGLALGSRMRR